MFYFNCILLIDDDPVANAVHKELFAQFYFADMIKDVPSAQEAFAFIEKFNEEKGAFPELILIDINMPGMDGFQFVEQLNKLPFVDKESFKISALTSSSDSRDIEMMNLLGVKHYVVKPLNLSKVKDLIYHNYKTIG